MSQQGAARRRMVRNAVASLGQTVASAALLFVLYREVLRELGPDALGVWSVVLATVGGARMAELGLSGSAVKYVAQYEARGDHGAAARVVETTVVAVAVGAAAASALAYGTLRLLLPTFVPSEGLDDALGLLPWACASLWFSMTGLATQSGLDGYQRFDVRNGVVLGGQAVFVGLALLWMPRFGLIGLAAAQLVQGVVTGVACWVALRWSAPYLPVIPRRLDSRLFREMFRYGAAYQGLGVLRLVYEPVTKSLLSAYGGLAAVGYFEMASQFVTKARALLVAAQQVITPEIAERQERAPSELIPLFERVDRLNWSISVPLFAGTAALAPLVAHAWIGAYSGQFVAFCALLCIGWLINAISGPGFFLLLGTGQMRPLLLTHMTIAIVNMIAGVALGMAAGDMGVVGGWTLALAAGGVQLVHWVARFLGLPLAFPRGVGRLTVGAVLAAGGSITAAHLAPDSVGTAMLGGVLAGTALALLIWAVSGRDLVALVRARRAPAAKSRESPATQTRSAASRKR